METRRIVWTHSLLEEFCGGLIFRTIYPSLDGYGFDNGVTFTRMESLSKWDTFELADSENEMGDRIG